MSKPILCIDFDGVIHSYSSGWQGETIIPDPPFPGAFVWLESLLPHFEVNIYSSRSKYEGGAAAMYNWFVEQGAPATLFTQLIFPTQKPAAYLTIDDRAICFNGIYPSIFSMLSFQPWYKKPALDLNDYPWAVYATPEVLLNNLLAIIHRDGGHYVVENGLQQAVVDAAKKHYEMFSKLDELQK